MSKIPQVFDSKDRNNTVQYTDQVSQKCTLETYMILLTNVTPMNLIKNKTKKTEIIISKGQREMNIQIADNNNSNRYLLVFVMSQIMY